MMQVERLILSRDGLRTGSSDEAGFFQAGRIFCGITRHQANEQETPFSRQVQPVMDDVEIAVMNAIGEEKIDAQPGHERKVGQRAMANKKAG